MVGANPISPLTTIAMNSSVDHVSTDIPRSQYAYVILTAVTSGLSIVGGSCICALFVAFKDMRTPVRTLLLFVAISDTLLAAGNFLGVIWYVYRDSDVIDKNKGFCVFQSALTIYFSSTSFFWTVTMAMSLFATVVLGKTSFTATYMKLFHLLAWIPPGVLLIVALGLDVLGTDTSLPTPSWCWIDPRAGHTLIWQLAAVKLWEIIAYIATVVLYTAVKISLRKRAIKSKEMVQRKQKSGPDVIMDASRKLTFVPLVFIVCRVWGTLRFFIGNFDTAHVNEPYVRWINPLQGIGDSAQGFANFIIYCYSLKRIRQRVGRYFCRKWYTDETTADTNIESQAVEMKRSRVGVVPAELDNEPRAGKSGLTTTSKSEPRVRKSGVVGLESGKSGGKSGDVGLESGKPGGKSGDVGLESGQPGEKSGVAGSESGQTGKKSGAQGLESGPLGEKSGVVGLESGQSSGKRGAADFESGQSSGKSGTAGLESGQSGGKSGAAGLESGNQSEKNGVVVAERVMGVGKSNEKVSEGDSGVGKSEEQEDGAMSPVDDAKGGKSGDETLTSDDAKTEAGNAFCTTTTSEA